MGVLTEEDNESLAGRDHVTECGPVGDSEDVRTCAGNESVVLDASIAESTIEDAGVEVITVCDQKCQNLVWVSIEESLDGAQVVNNGSTVFF